MLHNKLSRSIYLLLQLLLPVELEEFLIALHKHKDHIYFQNTSFAFNVQDGIVKLNHEGKQANPKPLIQSSPKNALLQDKDDKYVLAI